MARWNWQHWQIIAACLRCTVETLYSTIYYSKYFIELNFDKSTLYVALWTHKRPPYLALLGELWSVFYEYFNRNWSCYKGFLLYIACKVREGNLEEFFKHENAPFPPALSNYDRMCQGTKSDLLKSLEIGTRVTCADMKATVFNAALFVNRTARHLLSIYPVIEQL